MLGVGKLVFFVGIVGVYFWVYYCVLEWWE